MQNNCADAIEITLRPATIDDLDAINRVITAAVMTWDLPERVKRLSISSYLYNQLDLEHMQIIVAESSYQQLVGVAAWENASPRDLPAGKKGLLLHGIFVSPEHHHQGIGSKLFSNIEQAARQYKLDGLLVKAQSNAVDFFLSQGMQKLPVIDNDRDYENRFWKACTA